MPKKPPESKSLIALQRSRQAHVDRLKERGFKAKTFWLSPEALAALETLKATHDSEGAAVNAALIEAARRLGDADDNRELPPLTNAELKAIVAAMPVGKPAEAAPKDKTLKAIREAPARTAGAKLDIPVGPQPFQSRLKPKK